MKLYTTLDLKYSMILNSVYYRGPYLTLCDQGVMCDRYYIKVSILNSTKSLLLQAKLFYN